MYLQKKAQWVVRVHMLVIKWYKATITTLSLLILALLLLLYFGFLYWGRYFLPWFHVWLTILWDGNLRWTYSWFLIYTATSIFHIKLDSSALLCIPKLVYKKILLLFILIYVLLFKIRYLEQKNPSSTGYGEPRSVFIFSFFDKSGRLRIFLLLMSQRRATSPQGGDPLKGMDWERVRKKSYNLLSALTCNPVRLLLICLHFKFDGIKHREAWQLSDVGICKLNTYTVPYIIISSIQVNPSRECQWKRHDVYLYICNLHLLLGV